MKKIFALLLIACLAVGFAACGEDEPSALEPFAAAVAASAPKSASISTEVTSAVYNLTLKGEYEVTYNADGSATVAYEYDQLREITDDIGEDDELVYRTPPATATIAPDGTVTGAVSAQLAAVAGVRLNIDETKLTYSVSAGVLTATVKAENTASVLGAAVASDVTFTLSLVNGSVSALTLAYTTSSGGEAEIVCLYNYQ